MNEELKLSGETEGKSRRIGDLKSKWKTDVKGNGKDKWGNTEDLSEAPQVLSSVGNWICKGTNVQNCVILSSRTQKQLLFRKRESVLVGWCSWDYFLYVCGEMTRDRGSHQLAKNAFTETSHRIQCVKVTDNLMTHLGNCAISVKPPAEISSE